MKNVLSISMMATVLLLLGAFATGSASAGEYGYYGGDYYVGGCCDRGLLTSRRVYVVSPRPVYVVPAQPVYVVPARRVYVEDYGYRRYRGPAYYESTRHYWPRDRYYGHHYYGH